MWHDEHFAPDISANRGSDNAVEVSTKKNASAEINVRFIGVPFPEKIRKMISKSRYSILMNVRNDKVFCNRIVMVVIDVEKFYMW